MTGDPSQIAAALRRAAHSLIEADWTRDLEETMGSLVRTAVLTVPGAAGGGISRLVDGELTSGHPTDGAIAELDALQSRLRQGPCVSAAEEQSDDGVVYAEDLAGPADTDRWPGFAPRAAALGYRSLLAVGLWTGHHRYAALNLYARRSEAFSPEARLLAALFGTQAATLLHGAENAAGLHRALTSRDVIGQAKGVLMGRFGVGADGAFRQLVRASQDTNMKLVAVAQWVVDEAEQRATGSGPGVPALRGRGVLPDRPP